MLSFLTALLFRSPAAHAVDENGTFWMPPQGSTFAADVDFAYYFIYWIDIIFFILLMGAMLLFAIQYRHKKGVEAKTLDLKGSHAVELAWAVFPSFLLIAMFVLGFQAYMKQVVPPADALQVRVYAQKWQWNYLQQFPHHSTSDCVVDGPLYDDHELQNRYFDDHKIYT